METAEKVNANQITGTCVRFVPEFTRQGTTVTRSLASGNVTWVNINSISTFDGTNTESSGDSESPDEI